MIPGPYRNVALVGFMGAGKSTAGAALAERLGWQFADADVEIEREAGKPISRIFAEDGEPAFRALEERVAARLLARIEIVVALGGGAVTSPVTRERLRDGSFTVLLDVSPQTAWRRIEALSRQRPGQSQHAPRNRTQVPPLPAHVALESYWLPAPLQVFPRRAGSRRSPSRATRRRGIRRA